MNIEMQNKKLHICIVTGEFPGLTETFITTKVLELHKRGYKITVIKNQHAGAVNASHLALVKDAGIEVLSFIDISSVSNLLKVASQNPALLLKTFLGSAKKFKRNYRANRQSELLQKHPYDIVHFEFSGLAVSYFDALKRVKGKTVVSCRGTAEKVKPISEPDRVEKLKKLFAAVDGIHCVSDDMAATIKPYCNNHQKIFVNRPSIDLIVFGRTNEYNRKSKKVTVLTIGRFTFQKGYLIGLMAMKQLKSEGVDFIWKIVGDGPQKEELLFHIHTLQLKDYVELVGKKNRDEILELYNTVDMFLLPSVYEGIANVCLEAMSMELPVVSTKCGGMEEVIVHKQNGLLCEVYDPASIASNVRLVAEAVELSKRLGINARKTIVERFTIQQQADVFEEQYAKIVKAAAATEGVSASKKAGNLSVVR